MDVRIVDDVLVHLVGYHVGVVLLGELRDEHQLAAGEHFATGVRRIAQYEGLRILGEGGLQLLGVEVVSRTAQLHVDRDRSRQDGVRPVVLVIRGEHDHLVAGIDDGHHGDHHRLRAAAGDQHLRLRIHGPPHEPRLLPGEGLPETGCPPGHGVLMRTLASDLRQAVGELHRRIEVGESLREVDRPAFVRYACHTPDHRIGESRCPVRESAHLHASDFVGEFPLVYNTLRLVGGAFEGSLLGRDRLGTSSTATSTQPEAP